MKTYGDIELNEETDIKARLLDDAKQVIANKYAQLIIATRECARIKAEYERLLKEPLPEALQDEKRLPDVQKK